MTMKKLVALVVFALTPASALAQTPPTSYRLPEMNFDMWCQETMHYSPERCDKRLPHDNKAFSKYRSIVEHFELERLKNRRANEERSQAIMHNDNLDNPGNNVPTFPGSSGTIPNPH